jgi:hypothetical protein
MNQGGRVIIQNTGIRLHVLLLAVAGSLALASCTSAPSAEDAVRVVESYLQAKVLGNEAQVASLLCPEMEQYLVRESRTFDSVTGVRIEGMDCTMTGPQTVTCEGEIIADYGGENTVFPLTQYRVVDVDGAWRWCGEATEPVK